MINLELLEVVSLGIAILALWRLRPATFIIAGNQLLVLQALVNIRDFGQPLTESENPGALFSLDHVATASHLFALSTAVLLAIVLASPRRRPAKPRTLPPVPRWVLGVVLLDVVAAATSTRTILAYSRMDPERMVSKSAFLLTVSGLGPMLYSILLYELYRRVAIGRLRPGWAFLSIVALFTVTDYLHGGTGIASGFIVCAAILLIGAAPGRPTLRGRLGIGALVLAAALVAATVRNVRDDISHDGWDAVARASTLLLREEPLRARNAEGLESEGNGTAYATHVLEGIMLYDGGYSRHWQSLLDPLIYTFQPSFLVEPLGLTRRESAALELKNFFVSGGGSYLLGELYWNGGYPCVVFGLLLLALWAFLCDTRYRDSALWLMLTCQFAPTLVMSVGYGVTQIFRCWFDGLLVIAAYQVLVWFKRRRSGHRQARTRAPLRLRAGPAAASAGE